MNYHLGRGEALTSVCQQLRQILTFDDDEDLRIFPKILNSASTQSCYTQDMILPRGEGVVRLRTRSTKLGDCFSSPLSIVDVLFMQATMQITRPEISIAALDPRRCGCGCRFDRVGVSPPP